MIILLIIYDNELIVQINKGDVKDFRKLVEKYHFRVINTCFGFVKNNEDTEDVAQEVLACCNCPIIFLILYHI